MKKLILALLILVVLILNSALFFVLIYLIGKGFSWLTLLLLTPFAISGFREKDSLRIFIFSSLLLGAVIVTSAYDTIYLSSFCKAHKWTSSEVLDYLQSTPPLYSDDLPRGLNKETVALGKSASAVLSATGIHLSSYSGKTLIWRPISFEKLLEVRGSFANWLITLVVQNTSNEKILIASNGSEVATSYLACGPRNDLP